MLQNESTVREQQTVDSIRDWFRGCPFVGNKYRFGIDYLGKNPIEYAIFMSPSNIETATDITGETYVKPIQELNFAFASREKHPADVLQALANYGFYDGIINWIVQQNKLKSFPEISSGKVISIMPGLTQYLFEAEASVGRYQISCKMKYRRSI